VCFWTCLLNRTDALTGRMSTKVAEWVVLAIVATWVPAVTSGIFTKICLQVSDANALSRCKQLQHLFANNNVINIYFVLVCMLRRNLCFLTGIDICNIFKRVLYPIWYLEGTSSQSPTSHYEGSSSFPGQCLWGLWRTRQNLDRFVCYSTDLFMSIFLLQFFKILLFVTLSIKDVFK
jgi:hypothetical protein